MLYGFLEELHRFTRADVQRVAADLDSERTINKAPEPMAQIANGTAKSTALTPVDFAGQDIPGQLAALDRRVGAQEDFMRRLAVALQQSYSNR